MKKNGTTVDKISVAMYAGAISRYLDATGRQKHDLSSDLPKCVQDFHTFRKVIADIAEIKREKGTK